MPLKCAGNVLSQLSQLNSRSDILEEEDDEDADELLSELNSRSDILAETAVKMSEMLLSELNSRSDILLVS